MLLATIGLKVGSSIVQKARVLGPSRLHWFLGRSLSDASFAKHSWSDGRPGPNEGLRRFSEFLTKTLARAGGAEGGYRLTRGGLVVTAVSGFAKMLENSDADKEQHNGVAATENVSPLNLKL